MPQSQMNGCAASTLDIDTAPQVDGENQSQMYKRKLRSRINTSTQDVVKEAPIKKPTKRKLTEKKNTSKSSKPRRPASTKKKSSNENEERVIQHTEVDVNSEDNESEEDEEGSLDTSQNKTFLSCSVCNTDFSSAFILRLHLKIHEKVGNTAVVEKEIEENTNAVPSSQSQGTIKSEPCNDVDFEHEIDTTDTQEPNVKVEPNIKLELNKPVGGMLSKNFVENLKKNLSLAMNKNQ